MAHAYQIDFARIGASDTFPVSAHVTYRKCPVCTKIMNRVNFGARSGVITDQCGAHGVWLSAGELRRLLDWRKSGGALYHERVMKEKALTARKVERSGSNA